MNAVRKDTLVSGVVVGTVGVITFFLKDKKNRKKVTNLFNLFSLGARNEKPENGVQKSINKAGRPRPKDLEDTKMVSEGSTYGVNYYNQIESNK